MDIEQARTFIAVVQTGSFLGAAERVFVTQSTVSMRIKALEEQLGKQLFTRSKAGASLTPAGQQFQKHAHALVRAWEHAKLEVSLPEGFSAALTIGGAYSLWDGFLLEWLLRMRSTSADIAIKTEVGFSDQLLQHLINGTLDLGVMYTPQSRPGYKVEKLLEEELILVTSVDGVEEDLPSHYVYVDWGPEFRADHSLHFSELTSPGVYMEIGSLSLQYLLQRPAAGYFPHRMVKTLLEDGRLRRISGAPTFSYPAYAVYAEENDEEGLSIALKHLHEVAGQMSL